jgi:DNA-binding NarL/FixJ family response regulator
MHAQAPRQVGLPVVASPAATATCAIAAVLRRFCRSTLRTPIRTLSGTSVRASGQPRAAIRWSRPAPYPEVSAPRHDLITAVRTAATGNALLAPSVTVRLIDAFARRPAQTLPAPSRLASLTVREHDILLRPARGLTNAEIAADLVVSEATVKSHVGNLLAKLGLRDRVQAVILAYETGIGRPGEPDAIG